MMTSKKRVGPLPTHRLVVRHSVDYSSSGYFTFDDSSRDSPSDSSSEMSSDSYSDALSDSSSGHSSSYHSSPSNFLGRPSHSSSAGPSHKRSRYPTTYVAVSSPIPGALSYVRADLLPPRKRIRSSDSGSDEPYSEPDIDLEIQAEIDECIAYADALRAGGIDARVVVETVTREEVETSAKGTIKVSDDIVTHHVVSDDIPEPAQEEGAIEVTYETLGDLVQRIHDYTVEIPSAVLSERISELERDNMRLRGTTMPNTRSGATMKREAVNELIARRVVKALEARDAARNLEPLAEGGDEQGGENGDDYEGGNGNGNGGGNGYENYNMNFGGFMHVSRECTYQDFLKCQPLNFKGAEGFVRLTRWFKKMETVFHISNCPQKYQVKYAPCTLLDSDLTWWNTHKRTIRTNAAYAMTWTKLMKLTTNMYCPRNKI
ncbi:hypothetical protein Tco_0155965 [Tanacetum coccineum]